MALSAASRPCSLRIASIRSRISAPASDRIPSGERELDDHPLDLVGRPVGEAVDLGLGVPGEGKEEPQSGRYKRKLHRNHDFYKELSTLYFLYHPSRKT